MKRAQLWRITIATTREAEDAVAEALGAIFNRAASSYFHAKTGVSTASVFCEQRPVAKVRKEISARLKRIKDCELKIGSGKITILKVRREDWAESWKRHFKPIEVGNALLIKPSWIKRKPRKGQIVVVLDPGLGFGTGQHPTTAFCLRALTWHRKIGARRSFLDMGTGSGILAIAAAKLGYSPVYAFDFDPEAVRVARANARANEVHNKLRIERKDVTKLPIHPARQYDLICANLISTLLISERRRVVAQLDRGGTLVLAGILKSEFSQVQKMFKKIGLKLAARKNENEWCSGSFCFAEGKF
jgi:ribosomal protein L11 methyltransferase